MVFVNCGTLSVFSPNFYSVGKYFFIKKKVGYLVSGQAVSHGTLPIPALRRDMAQSGEDESFSRSSVMQEERKTVPFPWIHYQNDVNLELLRAIFVAM